MKSETQVQEMVKELDSFISYHSKFNHLFDGGCAFVAGVIIEECEKRFIPYNIISYTEDWVHDDNLVTLAEHSLIEHVAVEINDTIIGGEDLFNNCNNIIKRYHDNMTSEEIKDMYTENTWNDEWDINNNDMMESEIKMLFSIFD